MRLINNIRETCTSIIVQSYCRSKDSRMGWKARLYNGINQEPACRQAGARIGLRHYLNQKTSLNLITFMIIKTSEVYYMRTMRKLYRTVIIRQDLRLIQVHGKHHLKH